MRFLRLVLIVAALYACWALYVRRPGGQPGSASPAAPVAPLPASRPRLPLPDGGEQLWGLPKVELLAGVTKGWLRVRSVQGTGLYGVYLSLQSEADGPLVVAVVPGTRFQPQEGSTRDVVVTRERIEPLQPGEVSELSLEVASATMRGDPPNETSTFALAAEPASGDLRKLVRLPELSTSGVKQFAIWTITDNPERGGYAPIRSFGGPDRFPGAEDFNHVLALFLKAGISPGPYRALSQAVPPPPTRAAGGSPAPAAPLIAQREWTDKRGRTLRAELVTAALNPRGLFEGTFRRPTGEEFTLPIGRLSDADVQLVKETLIERGLYRPGRE